MVLRLGVSIPSPLRAGDHHGRLRIAAATADQIDVSASGVEIKEFRHMRLGLEITYEELYVHCLHAREAPRGPATPEHMFIKDTTNSY